MGRLELDDFDLDKLNETERRALERMLHASPTCWIWGMLLGLMLLVSLVIKAVKTGNPGTEIVINSVFSAGVFIGLSLWVRKWALLPAVLLLGWHLFANSKMASADSYHMKILYWGMAVIFLWGILSCNARRTLFRKAMPGSDAGPPVSEEGVRSLVQQGQKIRAVRMYRELHGVGLKEAKEAVDAIGRTESPEKTGASEDGIRALIRQGRKIEAVKEYRALYGVGLKEAKDAVDRMCDTEEEEG